MRGLGAGGRSILSNATYLFGSHVATTLFRGVYVVVLARALGPESFGVFNYALAWYLLFISVTYLGLDAYLVQRVGTDATNAPLILRQTLTIRAAAAVITAGASFALVTFVETEPYPRLLSGMFSIALIGRAVWLWAVSAFTAFECTHFALRWDAIFRPAEVAAALAVLMYRPDLHWLAATHALLWCVQGAVGLHVVAHRLVPFAGPVSMRELTQLLSQTLPAGIYAIVISAFMQGPIVLVKLIERDQFQLGQFVLAYQTCMYFLVVPYLFSTAMLPVMSRAVARGDGVDVGYVDLLIRIVCVFGAAVVVAFGPVIPPLTQALFGAEYSQAGQLLQSAMWLAIPFTAVAFLLQLFFARGAYTPIGICGALGASIMAVTMVPAMSFAPQVGPLLSTGAGMAVWLVLTLLIARVYVPTHKSLRSRRAFAATVVALLVHTLTEQFGAWPQMAISLAALAMATIAFGAIDRGDLNFLVRAMAGAFGARRV